MMTVLEVDYVSSKINETHLQLSPHVLRRSNSSDKEKFYSLFSAQIQSKYHIGKSHEATNHADFTFLVLIIYTQLIEQNI